MIPVEFPERVAEMLRLNQIGKRTIEIMNILKKTDPILSVQIIQHSEIAQLRRNGAIELIHGEVPETTTVSRRNETGSD